MPRIITAALVGLMALSSLITLVLMVTVGLPAAAAPDPVEPAPVVKVTVLDTMRGYETAIPTIDSLTELQAQEAAFNALDCPTYADESSLGSSIAEGLGLTEETVPVWKQCFHLQTDISLAYYHRAEELKDAGQ